MNPKKEISLTVTLKDIARAANVSPATVSRIINEDATLKVTEQTKTLVLKKIAELGYQPKKKRPQVVPHIALVTGLSTERSAVDAYWKTILYSIERQAKNVHLTDLIRLNADHIDSDLAQFDAVILIGDLAPTAIEELKRINPCLVVVDAKSNQLEVTNIAPDFETTMTEVLDLLAAHGKQSIAYIGGVNHPGKLTHAEMLLTDDERTNTYKNWVRHHQRPDLCYLGSWDARTGFVGVEELLRKHPHMDALVAGSDPIAMGVLNKLQQLDINPQSDMNIISFDNLDFANYLSPTLTSVDLNTDALAQMALDQAVSLSRDQRKWYANIRIPGTIIFRETFQLE